MKNSTRSLLFIALTSFCQLSFALSPVGKWLTIDDKTGAPRSVIEISERDGQYFGRIESVIKRTGDTGICSKCPEPYKGKPIVGLEILSGLKQTSEFKYENGRILDPKTGSMYNCNVTLASDDKSLKIRGYIGISLFGRTQTWKRQS